MSDSTSQARVAQAGDKDMRAGGVQVGSKAALRQEYLKIRDGLSADYRKRANKRIFEQLTASPEFARADTIFTYVSFRSEVDTHAIIKYALELGKRVAVPCCVPKTREMRWHVIASLNDLHAGAYNILEPANDPATLINPPASAPAREALALVPGVAFDARGGRLGYGGGYYDTFLSTFSGVSFGLCYNACFSHTSLPAEPHDVPVSRVLR